MSSPITTISEMKELLSTAKTVGEVDKYVCRAGPAVSQWLGIYSYKDIGDNILSWTLDKRNAVVAAWIPTHYGYVGARLDFSRHIFNSLHEPNSNLIECIHLIAPITPESFTWYGVKTAVENNCWKPVMWLGHIGCCREKLSSFLDHLWTNIITDNKIAWAEEMGSRVNWHDWTFNALCDSFTHEKMTWALQHPDFIKLVKLDDYDILYRKTIFMQRRKHNYPVTVLLNHFSDAAGILIRRAAQEALDDKHPNLLLAFVKYGFGNREVCLGNGGALLHALRHKKHAMSVLKRNFRLTRSDFASVGLSGAFFDDM